MFKDRVYDRTTMKRKYYVYMLRCSDNSLYSGVTNNIDRRLYEHQSGRNEKCYTYKRRPLTLVFCAQYQYILNAIKREKQLKRWTVEKKEALMGERFSALSSLSKRKRPWTIEHKIRFSMRRKAVRMLGGSWFETHCGAPHHDSPSYTPPAESC